LRQYAPFLSFILLWMLTLTCYVYLFKNYTCALFCYLWSKFIDLFVIFLLVDKC
jgi:hypothetical protein